MKTVAVIGAGAYGTALAVILAKSGRSVLLWDRNAENAAKMEAARENPRRLPGIALPENLKVSSALADIPDSAIQILAVPAQMTDVFLAAHGAQLPAAPMVLAAKGLGLADARLQSEIARQHLPGRPIAVISGPGFADEIARGLPTALSLACHDAALCSQLQARLSTPTFRLYTSTDLLGVQLGGALKNVIAIACGMCAGAALGESARAALMTRGFAEIVRLGRAMGAEAETFGGLAGMGDLALTSATVKSRNFTLGHALGRGEAPPHGKTVEGVATAEAAALLGRKHSVELPIVNAVSEVLSGSMTVELAMNALLARPLREERA